MGAEIINNALGELNIFMIFVKEIMYCFVLFYLFCSLFIIVPFVLKEKRVEENNEKVGCLDSEILINGKAIDKG